MRATKAQGSLERTSYEIQAFAKMLLEKAFAHHAYTWEEHLTFVAQIMDPARSKLLGSKIDESSVLYCPAG